MTTTNAAPNFCHLPELCQSTFWLFYSPLSVDDSFLNIKIAILIVLEEFGVWIIFAFAKTLFDFSSRTSVLSSHSNSIFLPEPSTVTRSGSKSLRGIRTEHPGHR